MCHTTNKRTRRCGRAVIRAAPNDRNLRIAHTYTMHCTKDATVWEAGRRKQWWRAEFRGRCHWQLASGEPPIRFPGGLAAEHRVRHGTATTPRRHACGGSGQHTVALKGAGTAVCRPQRRRDGLCAWCRPLRQKGTKRSGSGTAGHWGMPSPPSRTPPGRPPYKRITIVLPHFARTKHADATRAGGGNRKQQCRLRRSVRQRGHQQTAGVDAREYLLTPETYESSESHPRKICRFG